MKREELKCPVVNEHYGDYEWESFQNKYYLKSEADSVMDAMEARIKELEAEVIGYKASLERANFKMCEKDARIKDLEHHVPKWHQCEHPDSEGFYDLPPESGEYIVQVRSRSGRLETFAADFDADYSDWTDLINGSVVIQWCEEPKPSSKTQTAK